MLTPGRVRAETALGKVPVLVEDSGQRIHDSNFIIAHVRRSYGDQLDRGLTRSEQAVSVAFDRLLGEHLYWSGSIEPRWRHTRGWELYIHHILGGMVTIAPELRELLDDARVGILNQHVGHGMGRRPGPEVVEVFKADIDAISEYLGEKPFFLGAKPHWIDASVYSHLGHVIRVPFEWPGREYAAAKDNLTAYLSRMQEHFGFPELSVGSESAPLRSAA